VQLNLIGQTLGKYRILEEIGRGGMGVVYKAHDTVLDRPVAIKVLAPHLTWDQEFVKRFLHEARAAARLKHPNIVTIYDVGRAQGHHFIAMEYLEGDALDEIIRRRGLLSPPRVARLVRQVADALDYAHGQGLIHRDVKPGNVIVSPQDHATLTDFGIAKSLEGTRLTQSGVMVGTPSYMSPEQVKQQSIGPATDVYALGVVAYEMLGARPPFEGDTPHVLHAHVYEEPPPLAGVNPKVSPAVGTVVHKALAKEAGKRYGSAGAFAAALGQAVGSRETEVIRKLPLSRPPSPPTARVSQLPLWPLFGGLLAMLMLVVIVFGIPKYISEPRRAATQTAEALAATQTAAALVTETVTLTATPTETPTTPRPTEVPTATPTEAPTATPTETPMIPTPTEAPTPTPTETPMIPTPTEAPTPTPTEAPTPTPTEAPTPTPTEAPTPTPTPIPPTASIAFPQNGATVGESVIVRGVISGLGSGQRAFLCVKSQAFGRLIYPQSEIFPDPSGQWAVESIYRSVGYSYETFVVTTSNPDAAMMLADKHYRAYGMRSLPQDTIIISSVVVITRE
jgi:serine/threonine protein kinase